MDLCGTISAPPFLKLCKQASLDVAGLSALLLFAS